VPAPVEVQTVSVPVVEVVPEPVAEPVSNVETPLEVTEAPLESGLVPEDPAT